MNEDYKNKYLNTMIRFKKAGMGFPAHCDIQWSELLIMEKICHDYMAGETCINVSEIHENMCISKPAVSQTLNNLEKRGYIVREINSDDRRKISVQATPKGQEVLNRSAMTYEDKIRYISEQFGQKNMDTLIELLNKLSDLIDDIDE